MNNAVDKSYNNLPHVAGCNADGASVHLSAKCEVAVWYAKAVLYECNRHSCLMNAVRRCSTYEKDRSRYDQHVLG
jgi:hypothetical protein